MRLITKLLAQGAAAALIVVAIGSATLTAPVAVAAAPGLPGTGSFGGSADPNSVQATGGELSDANTGAVLWSRLPAGAAPMGSITKVMTALVVLEAGGLDRRITVPAGIVGYLKKYDGSGAGLVPGEVLTARDLLYGMLIPSGCDAAYALAYAYGPGPDAFIAKMNATARRLGLTGTHFTDFSGLPAPTEYSTYSTPTDLVTLGRDAMRLPLFASIVDQATYQLPAGPGHRAHTWQTSNQLLRSYPGAIGIKTGSTDAAGYCLLFEAVRGPRALIGVVLHSSTVTDAAAASDATTLLNWGFGQ